MSTKQRVVTVGSATAERVLLVDPDRFRLGAKHTVSPARTLAGGSAINHACRLLAAGIEALPIGPVCRDVTGDIVLETLDAAAAKGRCHPMDPATLFLAEKDLATPFTTITSVGTQRTIYTEFSERLFEPFEDHLEARLGAIDFNEVSALMVGHIHADRQDPPGRAGTLSEQVIRTGRAHDTPVFLNFGASQFRQGATRWEGSLSDIACFQLAIDEARTFLADSPGVQPALSDVLDWFASRCTVIITLERMGAVGRCKGSPNIVLTWPYNIEVADTTGAGDAFSAGVVAEMNGGITDDDGLRAAMERGGLFAAHACSTPGGADRAPSTVQLDEFRAGRATILSTEVTPLERARRILRLLDRAFPPGS